jgi:hypothetical protein
MRNRVSHLLKLQNRSFKIPMLFKIRNQLTEVASELVYKVDLLKHTPKLPSLNESDRAILNTLEREGVLVTSLDALSIPSTDQAIASANKIVTRLKNPDSDPGIIQDKNYSINRIGYTQLATEYPEIFLWGLNERLVNIIENYIGLPIACIGVDVRQDIGNGIKDVGQRKWHRDSDDRRQIRIIVYLSDVTENTIAFEYVPKHLTPINPFKSTYSDEEMKQAVPASAWKACHGNAGTAVMVATSDVYHHAKVPPTSGADRFTLVYTYTSRKPRRLQLCKDHFSREGLQALESNLSPNQRDYALWY